jgi:hypothetical protein
VFQDRPDNAEVVEPTPESADVARADTVFADSTSVEDSTLDSDWADTREVTSVDAGPDTAPDADPDTAPVVRQFGLWDGVSSAREPAHSGEFRAASPFWPAS